MRRRRIAVAALLVVGTLLWTAFGLGLWAQRQALEDNWVETSGDLLEDERFAPRSRSSSSTSSTTARRYRRASRRSCHPGSQGLAGPAAAGLKEIANRNAPRLLGAAAALKAWETANRTAH